MLTIENRDLRGVEFFRQWESLGNDLPLYIALGFQSAMTCAACIREQSVHVNLECVADYKNRTGLIPKEDG